MFCSNCGKQLGPGTNFCPACGTRVGVDSGAAYEHQPVSGQSTPDAGNGFPTSGTQASWGTGERRLYRPRSPRLLGGVCAAVALHYGWDLQLVRIMTAILTVFYGIGAVVYIACWIIIPEAQYALPSQSR